ncbi:MAG: HDOD domain-containing protein [Oscillospiraceae bacterium]|nr:HDOD domain-containing protein [Oscillospiraceae bacterium]
MELMVAPKAILDKYKDVKGYYLSFQIGNSLIEGGKSFALDNSTSSPFFELINDTGLESLTGNKLLFVPVTSVLLATDLENVCKVDRSLIALLIDNKVELSDSNLLRIARFRQLGFKIAFRNIADIESLESFFPNTDYLFCGNDPMEIMSVLGKIQSSGHPIQAVVTNVDSKKTFDAISVFSVGMYEGDFYRDITIREDKPISPFKLNYLQLLNEVTQEDFEFDRFAQIVQRDTVLAVNFLKMVNSSSLVRNNKITSLKHAAALLGQKEIKKWATTAVTSALGQESPGEVIRVSMLRAKFCENLAPLFEMAILEDNLFLMGLFSVLDVILDMTMEKALHLVYVPEPIRDALLGKGNDFSKVYKFIKDYEQGDWTEVSRTALVNKIGIDKIATAYHDALVWYGRMVGMQISETDDLQDLVADIEG